MKKLLIIIILTGLISACNNSMHESQSDSYGKTSFDSIGEQIYYTGRSSSGDEIKLVGGHHHMQIRGGGCVTCHGVNREGGARMWPRFWISAPSITRESLLGDHQDEGHSHSVYTAELMKRALSEGLNPSGERLDDLMPRWRMSERDMNSIVHYLLDSDEPHDH